jgi:very-short-patch-repair endonuclease
VQVILKKTQKEVIKILKKYNLKIYKGEIYKNSRIPIKCVDLEGYIVYPTLGRLKEGKLPKRFDKSNPSIVKNIKHYIEITDDCKNIELISNNFESAKSKLIFKCKIHGFFEMRWDHFQEGNRCPKCNQSKGENRIESWLKQNNINYETQYIFNDCKYISLLRFDFYLPNRNICIEYDGKQHFRPVDFSGENYKKALQEFKLTKKRDKIKNDYCKTHNIPLLRIPYTEFDNIETILENFLKETKINNNKCLTKSENVV